MLDDFQNARQRSVTFQRLAHTFQYFSYGSNDLPISNNV